MSTLDTIEQRVVNRVRFTNLEQPSSTMENTPSVQTVEDSLPQNPVTNLDDVFENITPSEGEETEDLVCPIGVSDAPKKVTIDLTNSRAPKVDFSGYWRGQDVLAAQRFIRREYHRYLTRLRKERVNAVVKD